MTSLIHLKLSSRTLMGIKSTDETPIIKTPAKLTGAIARICNMPLND